MTIGLLFWVIMLIELLFGLFFYWPHGGATYYPLGGHMILWVLFALLGWQVFGPAIKKG